MQYGGAGTEKRPSDACWLTQQVRYISVYDVIDINSSLLKVQQIEQNREYA